MSIPKSYKAVTCISPNQGWKFIDVEGRQPAPHEVVIKVKASGICGSDHFVQDGTWPGLQYPRIPGHEAVGRVVAVGSAVDPNGRFKIGSLVGAGWNGGYCGSCSSCREGDFPGCSDVKFTGFSFDGGHAEYHYAPQNSVVNIPESALEGASYAELAPLLCAGATVYDAILTSQWKPGDICLVQGIGGLGHLAIQYAAKFGLKVFATSSGPSKASLAKEMGAYEHLDSSSIDVVQYMQSLGGAKLIVATAPYAKLISSILPAVGRNGTITLVSAATDGNIEVQNLLLNMNRATLRGWSCGDARDAEKCIKFSVQSNVKAIVKTFPLEKFSEAYDDVIHGRPKFRNVIVFP